MMAKLFSAGVADNFLNFLNSYLEPRVGKVTVEGALSDIFELSDTVFQGTVLGPTLWNVFFSDVAFPASLHGGSAAIFADDLNVFKCFDVHESNEEIAERMAHTQSEVHQWGQRNRVSFDQQKEHLNIIHPIQGEGDNFKLLGNLIDVKLLMTDAIEEILTRARPKVKALLRTRGIYDTAHLIMQYKTHIWGITEYQNGCIMHAAPSALERIDSLQRGFLNELNISESQAFVEYNFAPPVLRRDIGILA